MSILMAFLCISSSHNSMFCCLFQQIWGGRDNLNVELLDNVKIWLDDLTEDEGVVALKMIAKMGMLGGASLCSGVWGAVYGVNF